MWKMLVALLLCCLFAGAAQAGEKVTVSLIAKAMDSEWWRTVREGAQKFADENPDLTIHVLAPDRELNDHRLKPVGYSCD